MTKREDTRRCALEYVRAMAVELKDIASANGAENVAHLLEIAALEAGGDHGAGANGLTPNALPPEGNQPRKRLTH